MQDSSCLGSGGVPQINQYPKPVLVPLSHHEVSLPNGTGGLKEVHLDYFSSMISESS